MGGSLLVVVAVLIANVSGVAVSLVVPAFLPPDQYSNFALAWSVGQFLSMLFFEWLRFSALRFSVGPDVGLAKQRKAVLVAAYRRLSPAIIALAAFSLATIGRGGVLAILPFALVYAVCQGSFDGFQAFARASRDNVGFARNWAMRALFSIGMVVVVAWMTRNGGAATIALSLSFPLTLAANSILSSAFKKPRTEKNSLVNWGELPKMARFGLFAAVSGVIANGVPTIVRWALVDFAGKNAAAGALLAADLSQKALAVTGMAVNVIAMQNSFTAVDTGDRETINRSNQNQIVCAIGAVLPIGIMVWLMSGDVANILMRPAYRTGFLESAGLCALASGMICVRLFAIDPLFYAFNKAGLSVVGAATSLALCSAALALPNFHPFGRIDPLLGFVASAGAGLIVSTLLAITVLKIRLPWTQLARLAMAAGVMIGAWELIPHGRGVVGFVLLGGGLALLYATAAVASNVAGLRDEAFRRINLAFRA